MAEDLFPSSIHALSSLIDICLSGIGGDPEGPIMIAVTAETFARLVACATAEQLLGGPGADLEAEDSGEIRIGNVTWVRANPRS